MMKFKKRMMLYRLITYKKAMTLVSGNIDAVQERNPILSGNIDVVQ